MGAQPGIGLQADSIILGAGPPRHPHAVVDTVERQLEAVLLHACRQVQKVTDLLAAREVQGLNREGEMQDCLTRWLEEVRELSEEVAIVSRFVSPWEGDQSYESNSTILDIRDDSDLTSAQERLLGLIAGYSGEGSTFERRAAWCVDFFQKVKTVCLRAADTITRLNWTEAPMGSSSLEDMARMDSAQLMGIVDRVCLITSRAQREPGDPDIARRGGVIADTTPALILEKLGRNAKLMSYRNEQGNVVAYAIFSDRAPEHFPNIEGLAMRDEPLGYLLMLCRNESRDSAPAARALLNAMLVHLQRTGTKNLVAHVQEENARAVGLYSCYGGAPVSAAAPTALSPSGAPTRFLTMLIPVDPRLRDLCLSKYAYGVPQFAQAVNEKRLDGLLLPSADTTALESRYGGLSRDAAVAHLSGAGEKVAVVLTGGCANMSLEDSERLIDYFRVAFSGLDFAFVSGGTRMQFAAGREITESVLPGITEVLPAIASSLGEGARILGVVAVDEVRSAEKQNVESGVPKQNVTVVNPEFSHLYFVSSGEYGEDCEGQWHAEAFGRLDVARALQTQGFRVITVLYNGGGITDWEISQETFHTAIRIQGSGRVADDVNLRTADGKLTTSANIDDPKTLRRVLLQLANMDHAAV